MRVRFLKKSGRVEGGAQPFPRLAFNILALFQAGLKGGLKRASEGGSLKKRVKGEV